MQPQENIYGSQSGLYDLAKHRYQRFFQPRTCAPQLMNSYGWIDAPKTGDLVIPIYSLLPTDDKTMYWIYESIVTNSSTAIRCALEGNFSYDQQAGQFDPNAWKITTGYAIRADCPHRFEGTVIKTKPGEAIRLRIHASSGADNDIYFKFIGLELPFTE